MTEHLDTVSRVGTPRRCWHWVAAFCAVLVLHGERVAAQSWTITDSEVRIRCALTVGGSFDAATTAVSGVITRSDRGATSQSGEVIVDLSTLDTGVELRDRHLRTKYLEIDRGADYARGVLSMIRLDDPMPRGTGTYKTGFSGVLLLHGVKRALTGEVELSRTDGRLHVEATFSISLDAFEIPPPRYLGVGVRDEVHVVVGLDAATGTTAGDTE
jgi:polyisoprenoid-binding protein YceI